MGPLQMSLRAIGEPLQGLNVGAIFVPLLVEICPLAPTQLSWANLYAFR